MSHSACIPIDVPANDPFYRNYNLKCLQFLRSQCSFATDCQLKGAQQVNQVSHYVDMSVLYGSDATVGALLRTHSDGKLLSNPQQLLPQQSDCPDDSGCYFTGEKLILICGLLIAQLFSPTIKAMFGRQSLPFWQCLKCRSFDCTIVLLTNLLPGNQTGTTNEFIRKQDES